MKTLKFFYSHVAAEKLPEIPCNDSVSFFFMLFTGKLLGIR
jgi:hypothetical protein